MKTTALVFVLTFAVLTSSIFATIIHVPGDQTTIQSAIDAAADGDTIQVATGLYPENPTISGKVILLGAMAGIDPDGSLDRGSEAVISGSIAVDSGADETTINGLKIDGGGIVIEEAADVSVIYNIIVNAPSFAVQTDSRISISDNSIAECDGGIRAEYDGGSVSDRIEISGNDIAHIANAGIAVSGTYTYIFDNYLYQCNYYGPDGNGGWDRGSIYIEDGADYTTVTANTISDGIHGIQTWANSTIITNNFVMSFGLTYADQYTIGGRNYKNSGVMVGSNWGLGDHDPVGVVVKNNSFEGNFWHIFHNSGLSETVDASGNWLNATTSGGAASRISVGVDYTPWLASGADTDSGAPGFQGNFSSLWVDDNSPQASTGRLHAGRCRSSSRHRRDRQRLHRLLYRGGQRGEPQQHHDCRYKQRCHHASESGLAVEYRRLWHYSHDGRAGGQFIGRQAAASDDEFRSDSG